nr:hypothetical protein [uncultured Mediterraneibacter sp.]
MIVTDEYGSSQYLVPLPSSTSYMDTENWISDNGQYDDGSYGYSFGFSLL